MRTGRLPATAVLALGLAFLAPAVASASTDPPATDPPAAGVLSGGLGLNIRTGPGQQYPERSALPEGATVKPICVTHTGRTWTGPAGTTNAWLKIGDDQWVSGAYVSAGKLPECPAENPVAGHLGGGLRFDPADYLKDDTAFGTGDVYGYYQGQCTSFAAWALGRLGVPATEFSWMGNAADWHGPVDPTPHVGDVAQWDPYRNGAGGAGHVGVVAAVDKDATVRIWDYNWEVTGKDPEQFHVRTVPVDNPSRYLAFR